MQSGRPTSLDAEVDRAHCAFCQQSTLTRYILKETPNFRLITDHAPLVEGHLLIIPKTHYSCYGDIPPSLDEEIFSLKDEVKLFFERYYSPVIFWEHGIFRQTVYHAHLHCFPFGPIDYGLDEELHARIVHSQDDIRSWFKTNGPYFYMEDKRHALLFKPDVNIYMKVIQEVLWRRANSKNGHREWRVPQQRLEDGKPLIQSVITHWREFQEQGV
ncbi:MAG TPA: HIT domain-containing protein [Ktedonobacteraceae bacterium]|nr:HIT domain-containing protein [Ktedonobacteraceae bacterium]